MNAAVWQKRVNTVAFLLAICCVAVFLVFGFIQGEGRLVFHFHPLVLNLWLAVFTFFLGMIGFSGVRNGKRFLMGIITLLTTFTLSVALLFILMVGKLLS